MPRIEKDSLGEVEVPDGALYGAQTKRAVDNFPVSGVPLPRAAIRALGLIKGAVAEANAELGELDPKLAAAIAAAAREVADGKHDEAFPVDVFQTGSGTSSNMNANEVIANLAIRALGGEIGSKRPVHPNDHVNRGQSSNDVFPSAAHLAVLLVAYEDLFPGLRTLHRVLADRAKALDSVVKLGRTHLMDAVPVRLGQVFGGYTTQIAHGIGRLERASDELRELPLGGTAVGTGLNGHPKMPAAACARLTEWTGIEVREAEDHFEAQSARDAMVSFSGALRTVAVSLMKIANDVRWMASGPRAGLAEIRIPDLQPGSSIMPGKVNPVLCETVTQVAAQAIGCDAAVAVGGQSGVFELNVMIPMMLHNVVFAATAVANASRIFAERCVAGIEANEDRCRAYAEASAALVTPLNPRIGYDKAAEIAKEAVRSGRSIVEVAKERSGLPADEVERLLDPVRLTRREG